jgi:prolyl oligopeptidase
MLSVIMHNLKIINNAMLKPFQLFIGLLTLTFSINSMAQNSGNTPAPDPRLYLEEVLGESALKWVKEQNAISRKAIEASPNFAQDKHRVLEVLDNKERIPDVTKRGQWYYNLLRDAQYKVGLWRRTTLAEYRKPEPKWEAILDLDALAASEKENWVWAGAQCLAPNYNQCLISLSRGGADAVVVREFDLLTKQFVKNGFTLPEAKTSVTWEDANTLLVGTNFGTQYGGSSMTDSGYPRVFVRWLRGTPLTSAKLVYQGKQADVAAFAMTDRKPGKPATIYVGRAIDFYSSEVFLVDQQSLKKIPVPLDANFSPDGERFYLELRSNWAVGGQNFKAGSLLTGSIQDLLTSKNQFQLLFEPTASASLDSFAVVRDGVVLNILDNVAGRLEEWRQDAGKWSKRQIKAPSPGSIAITSLHDDFLPNDDQANSYFLTYTDFLTPTTLSLASLGTDQRELLKTNPVFFNAQGMRSEQRSVVSKDGTKIPYFVIFPAGFKAGQTYPTLLYGYGGFQVSEAPRYSGGWGRTWLERGGVLVIANIRGGGEFGPLWHQAAMKANKQRSYDDFIAVAEQLSSTGVTKPAQLGIMGGSNGGLLVGAVMVQRPELFGAVVCSVPLLDMQRYHKLLAGNSWMAEYGDPDKPEEWAYISRYSPYHNVKAQVKYPRLLLATSTRDDRVHPGHARKMAALMLSQGRGPQELLYYENIEGGHGGAANNEQRADLTALEMTFLWQTLAPTAGSAAK